MSTPETLCTQAVRLLVVEDNRVVQQYILAALRTDPGLHVLGVADNGHVGLSTALQQAPDVILLDLFLPGMDGIEIIQRVMHERPCPIIVLSGELDSKERDLAFEAQRAGAVAVLAKPQGMSPAHFDSFSRQLCHTVRLMAQVKVTRRWLNIPSVVPVSAPSVQPPASTAYSLMAIGCSTGGPSALYALLEAIAPAFPFAVVIAQHIEKGFGDTLCEWLGKSGCNVRIPANGEKLQPGVAYLAPDDQHLVIGPDGYCHRVDNPAARFTPSVDMLFSSIAENIDEPVCAIILTGMGNDGTAGLRRLYEKGAWTIAEDESSAVVFGMPAAAIQAGIVRQVEPLDGIARFLAQGVTCPTPETHSPSGHRR